MRNLNFGGMIQCLVNDAISLCQAKQSSDLLFVGISVQIEVYSNLLESDWHILGDAKSAAKIEIAFGPNRCVSQLDAESSRYCAQGDAGTGHQCPQ